MSEIYPPITFSESDYGFLSGLVFSHDIALSEVHSFLEHELSRGKVVPDGRLPATVVAIGRSVTYRETKTGKERTIKLVPPGINDINQNAVSVATPVGAALIGLREKQVIAWVTWADTKRMLEVVRVHTDEG